MAVKKSELYSALWRSCDELRGGMDASQYKDYVLVLLFIKYVSDKYAGQAFAPINIPKGSSFSDMVKLKGKPSIGEDINKKIIGPIKEANGLSGMPDFSDKEKLGDGKEMVEKLTNLISIFEDKALDFSNNRAEHDDILGDAYEFLMRNFAQQSGKSKGQFYTPSEVSLMIAKIISFQIKKVTPSMIGYDPTCGSGSLLLKVSDEFNNVITLYGQEKDVATAGMARMNMILHNNPGAEIKQGNTLTNPLFKNGNEIKQADMVVANPPFSDKSWLTGMIIDGVDDSFHRFVGFGIPPAKNGDYAYLLHIIKSMKSTGKGACILPHGVLFRGNVEGDIRTNLIKQGFIKGIIGLPQNLFYGTGIAACILILDKEESKNRKGIFMIDASRGFMKDGDKNRLRSRDIHKIVDIFNSQADSEKYARFVPNSEIEANGYNLNISRYIDTQEEEDIQDIKAHLTGEIPNRDIESLSRFWEVCPSLQKVLFGKGQNKEYSQIKVEKDAIKTKIFEHSEFQNFSREVESKYSKWKKKHLTELKNLKKGFKPKELIHEISESILKCFEGDKLIDQYDIYQHLMDFWYETMQDDCYLLSQDGWKAETRRIIETVKGKPIDKGWYCDLIPKELVIAKYFQKEKQEIENLESELESKQSRLKEIEEENGGEDGLFADFERINKATVSARLKEITNNKEASEEKKILEEYLQVSESIPELNKKIKDANIALDKKLLDKYPKLKEEEIKSLVVDDKWLATLEKQVHSEMDRVSQTISRRLIELAERYETPLSVLDTKVEELEKKVNKHLKKMGVVE